MFDGSLNLWSSSKAPIQKYSHASHVYVLNKQDEIFFGSGPNDAGQTSFSMTSSLTTITQHLSFGYYCYTKERGGVIYLIVFLYIFALSVPLCYYCYTKERGKLFLLHNLYLYIRAQYFFGSIITLNTYISYFYLLEKHNIKDSQCRATDSIKRENTFYRAALAVAFAAFVFLRDPLQTSK